LRGRVDAVLVGVGTVLADDPALTCRHVKPRRIAARVVVDTHLRTPTRARLVTTAADTPTMIFTARTTFEKSPRRVRTLERAGVEVVDLPTRQGRIDLRRALLWMGKQPWTSILVEGGGGLLGAFLDADLADEAHVFVAPRLIGGSAAPGPLGGTGPTDVGGLDHAKLTRSRRVGPDTLHHFLIRAENV
jgi:diaminohydroxyphosphoribosylaminopyrimidine deaminase/5-amino-6-(5-phosphoribosylamino)uracil reductase